MLAPIPVSRFSLTAIVALGLVGSAARAQTVVQGFEPGIANTWAYTPTPATYNDAMATDQWAELASVGTAGAGVTVAMPSAGPGLWGGRDLEGPQTNNLSLWHHLDFSPVAILSGTAAANTITFKYFSNAFDGPDSLAYVVRFDNGTTWPMPRTCT